MYFRKAVSDTPIHLHVEEMAYGIFMNTASRAKQREYIHLQTSEWSITSSIPCTSAEMLTCPLLPLKLPGALGRYVYPEDAVFTWTDAPAASQAKWKALLATPPLSATETKRRSLTAIAAPLPQTVITEEEAVPDDEDDIFAQDDDDDEYLDKVDADSCDAGDEDEE